MLSPLLLIAAWFLRCLQLRRQSRMRRQYPRALRRWRRYCASVRAHRASIHAWCEATVDASSKPVLKLKRQAKILKRKSQASEFAYPAQLEKASRLSKPESKHKWLVDSGASSHISPHECEVVRWRTRTRSTFKTASGKRAVCIGRGDIVVKMKDESGKKVRIVLENVAIIPESPMRLIAISKLEDAGGDVSFRKRKLFLPNLSGAGHTAYPFERTGSLYLAHMKTVSRKRAESIISARLTGKVGEKFAAYPALVASKPKQSTIDSAKAALVALEAAEIAMKAATKADAAAKDARQVMKDYATLMHENLCHASKTYLMTFGFRSCDIEDCEECMKGKIAAANQSRKPRTKPPYNFHTIHVDLAGPLPKSKEGYRYIVGITCGRSDYTQTYAVKRKSDAVLALKRFIIEHNVRVRNRLRIVQVDGGGELTGGWRAILKTQHLDGFKRLAKIIGAEVRQSAPHNQAQNGKIERKWRWIKDTMRTLLSAAKQKNVDYWPYSLATATYTLNRIAHKAIDMDTPHNQVFGKRPSHKHMRKWGCECVVKDENKEHGLSSKGRKGTFMGYSADHADGTYLVLMHDTKRIIASKNVRFKSEHTKTSLVKLFDAQEDFRIKAAAESEKQAKDATVADMAPRANNSSNNNMAPTSTADPDNSTTGSPVTPTATSTAQQTTAPPLESIDANPNGGIEDHRQLKTGNKKPRVHYITERINQVIGKTVEEAIAMKMQYTTTNGATKTYTKRDINYDVNHGYLRLSENSEETAAMLICDQFKAGESVDITVEDYLGSWDNLTSTEHVMMAKSASPTASTPPAPSPDHEYTRNSKEPRTVEEALKMKDAPKWKEAIVKELQALIDMNTWELVPLPKGRKAVGCRMVLKRKFNADGTIDKYKARAVLKGYAQRKHVDYEETFAPVGRLETFRLMLSMANTHDYNLRQIDFSNAFLNATMDKELYMQLPPGLNLIRGNRKVVERGYVCKLLRGLYGAKQSPALWNSYLHEYLINDLGFTQSPTDPCLYTIGAGEAVSEAEGEIFDQEHCKSKSAENKNTEPFIALLAYVDDCCITGDSPELIDSLVARIKRDFNGKLDDMGELKHFLGMEIRRNRDRGTLDVGVDGYILNVLERFKMDHANGRTTPIPVDGLCTRRDCPDPNTEAGKAEIEEMKKKEYRALIGALLWIHRTCVPSIAYSVHHLSTFSNNPGLKHWKQAQGVLKYLKHHVDSNDPHNPPSPIGLRYSRKKIGLEGYVDASFADNYGDQHDNRRSTTGWCFMSGGAAVSWRARRQSTIATSTAEAEYIAAFEATKEALYIRRLMSELGQIPSSKCITLYEDSQACIKIATNPCLAERTKHFDIKYHWLREKVKKNDVELKYIRTTEQVADILTKGLGERQHTKLRTLLTGL